MRIKANQVGICGTDLLMHHGDFNAVFPLTPGHDVVGTVDQLSDGSRSFGEQVTVNPKVWEGGVLNGGSTPPGCGVVDVRAWTKRPPRMPLDAGEVGNRGGQLVPVPVDSQGSHTCNRIAVECRAVL